MTEKAQRNRLIIDYIAWLVWIVFLLIPESLPFSNIFTHLFVLALGVGIMIELVQGGRSGRFQEARKYRGVLGAKIRSYVKRIRHKA